MKKILAIFAVMTLLLSAMLPVVTAAEAINETGKNLIEAESMVVTKFGDGTSSWANLQNKIMFYEGVAASGRFFVGTNGENYTWGEPGASQFKLSTTRTFASGGWFHFSYVVSSRKVGNSVSAVHVVLHPAKGGEDITVGGNAYPKDGIPDGVKVEQITFTNNNTGTNFINQYMGIFRYHNTVYVPAGEYEIEFLPEITEDGKYKFYADYLAIEPGTEPEPEPEPGITADVYHEAGKTTTRAAGGVGYVATYGYHDWNIRGTTQPVLWNTTDGKAFPENKKTYYFPASGMYTFRFMLSSPRVRVRLAWM